jgi:hypothetical protein
MSSGRLLLAIYELAAFQAVFHNITSSCSLTSLWFISRLCHNIQCRMVETLKNDKLENTKEGSGGANFNWRKANTLIRINNLDNVGVT